MILLTILPSKVSTALRFANICLSRQQNDRTTSKWSKGLVNFGALCIKALFRHTVAVTAELLGHASVCIIMLSNISAILRSRLLCLICLLLQLLRIISVFNYSVYFHHYSFVNGENILCFRWYRYSSGFMESVAGKVSISIWFVCAFKYICTTRDGRISGSGIRIRPVFH